MTNSHVLLLIAGMFVVTYPARLIPLALFNRKEMPRLLRRWLRYIPIAVFASILTQTVYGEPGEWSWERALAYLPALVGALLVTVKRRSMAWGIVFGYMIFLLTYYVG